MHTNTALLAGRDRDRVWQCDSAVAPSAQAPGIPEALPKQPMCWHPLVSSVPLLQTTRYLLYFKDVSFTPTWRKGPSISNVFLIKAILAEAGPESVFQDFWKNIMAVVVTERGMCCEKTDSSREEFGKRHSNWKNSFPVCLNFSKYYHWNVRAWIIKVV